MNQSIILYFNIIALLGAALLCIYCLVRDVQKRPFPAPAGKRHALPASLTPGRTHWLLFALLMALALFVRVWRFGSLPAGFNQDGAMAAVDALALSQYGTDRLGMWLPAHLTAWGFGQMSALLSYVMAPLVGLFGLNPIAARLPLLIVSMLGLWVLYLLARDLAGKNAALVVLAFAAINPWHIMQSRWALDCNLFPHLMLFGVYFLQKGLRRPIYAYLSMLFFGLCMYAYGIAFFLIPLFLLGAVVYILRKRLLTWGQAGICAGVYLLVAWPILLVMLLNTFGLPTIELPFVTIPFFEDRVRSSDLLVFSSDIWGQFKTNVAAFCRVLFLQDDGLPWNVTPGFGTIYLFSLPFAVYGVICAIRSCRKDEKVRGGIVLLLIWLALSVFTGLFVASVNVNRINILFYCLLFFGGLGLTYAARRVRECAVPACAVYAVFFLLFCSSYFGAHGDLIGYYFYDGFGEAVRCADAQDCDRVYITNYLTYKKSPSSEILTQFHLNLDAHYTQGLTDERTEGAQQPYERRYRYLAIDSLHPDPEDSFAYVANKKELFVFDPDKFEIREFGGYAAVWPKED